MAAIRGGMTMVEKSENDDDYRKQCAKRRMNGLILLVLGGLFAFVARIAAKQASSPEEAQGAYAVPVIVFVIAFYYLLSKPKPKQ